MSMPCEVNGCPRNALNGLCFVHKPKKPMRISQMRKESSKTKEKRIATNKAWDEKNPPDEWGYWTCYLRIHPWCPIRIDRTMLNREHDKSKARHKELEHDVKQIKPACGFCNQLKASLTAEEAIKKYGQKED
jgi:hypothetical protein